MTSNPKDEPVFIIGHLNPDTDSVCSAIAYAHFLKEKKGRSDIIAACAGHLNDETKFALKYFHQKQPHHLQTAAEKNIILVDHNEVSLSLPDIKEANIMEIIDHHRIGDIETTHPIAFVNLPLGSTASIIAERYSRYKVPISKKMAGLMLSALVSDTILLNSPTTTSKDRTLAEKLAAIAEVNLHEYGRDLLEAGCNLITHSPKKIINTDFKKYGSKPNRIGIAQVNVADTRVALRKKKALLKEMDKMRLENDYKYIMLMITNIISLQTDLLISGDDLNPISKRFKKHIEHNMMILPNTVSRKKQIQPKVLKLI